MVEDRIPATPDSETRVSVCMATYNGGRFVVDQLQSILAELDDADEIVIVDDASTDDTVEIIRSFDDKRIRFIRHETNRGYVRTFEHALSVAQGDILLLADQDDIWIPGRRARFVHALASHQAAASDLVLLGTGAPLPSPLTGRPWRLPPDRPASRFWDSMRVIAGVQPYYGCAMAIRRDFVDVVLPFPDFLYESHDLWIALTANSARQMRHLAGATVQRRIHDANTSPSRPRGLGRVLRARWMLTRALVEGRRRVRRAHRSIDGFRSR